MGLLKAMMKVNISKSIPTKVPCPQAKQLIAIQKSSLSLEHQASCQLNTKTYSAIQKSFLTIPSALLEIS